MRLSNDEEESNRSLSKFESMLKTNKVLFFDSEEFEDIILHYMDTGRMNLAKKALKLGLEQHPKVWQHHRSFYPHRAGRGRAGRSGKAGRSRLSGGLW